jgi:ABC-type polysaccharide/polyol phosphate transport system ATPase subunit
MKSLRSLRLKNYEHTRQALLEWYVAGHLEVEVLIADEVLAVERCSFLAQQFRY